MQKPAYETRKAKNRKARQKRISRTLEKRRVGIEMKKLKRIIAVAALIFAVITGGYVIHTARNAAKQISKMEGVYAEETRI